MFRWCSNLSDCLKSQMHEGGARFLLLRNEREGDEIKIWYDRSDVPNDVDLLMDHQGESCFAWHNIGMDPFWQFLEGYPVEEADERRRTKAFRPAATGFASVNRGDLPQYADGRAAFHGYQKVTLELHKKRGIGIAAYSPDALGEFAITRKASDPRPDRA